MRRRVPSRIRGQRRQDCPEIMDTSDCAGLRYLHFPIEGRSRRGIHGARRLERVAKRPDRFVALGTVPLNDGTEAAKELERAMTTLGIKGAEILTNVAGRELSDPEFSPFWKK